MSKEKDRITLENQFKKGKIPFAIDKTIYEKFSQRNTNFARVVWDESFISYRRPINERASEKVGMKGYSRAGYAAVDASWTIYDKFPNLFNWDSIIEIEGSSPTQLTHNLPKYESNDLTSNTSLIKRIGQIFGACAIGIAEIDESFIYSHNRKGEPITLPDGIQYAIVMLIEMDYEGIGTSPALPGGIATGNGYSRMAFTIACVAEFLRNLGFRAIPCGNDTGMSVPLAVQAGLGQFGRNGLLITQKYGQRVRICKVFTDFPMEIDKPIDFGVTQFCRVCKKCAQYCPSQSIPYDKDPTWESPWDTISNNSGTYKWYVNVDTCYEFWVKNSGDCSNCIRLCPFTKPSGLAHDITRFFIKNFRFLDRMWVWMDDFMGKIPLWRYGQKRDPDKFWLSNKYLGKKSIK
jgi:reductive dehalogenase